MNINFFKHPIPKNNMKELSESLKKFEGKIPRGIATHIKEKDGKIQIDWEYIKSTELSGNEEGVLYELLIHLGILSTESKDNYLLTSSHSVLNPLNPSWPSTLYFTREEDAINYNKVFYGKSGRSRQFFKGI